VGCVRHPECWWGCPKETRHSGRPEGLARHLLSLQRDRGRAVPTGGGVSHLTPDRH